MGRVATVIATAAAGEVMEELSSVAPYCASSLGCREL